MRIQDVEERRFYEIECEANDWSLREFQRQFDSGLYERLALSRDKEGVMALAKRGQIVEKPEDLIKDPYIKLADENKSIGIILCKSKSKTLVEITLPEDNNTIFASQYRIVFPHKSELKRLLSDKP